MLEAFSAESSVQFIAIGVGEPQAFSTLRKVALHSARIACSAIRRLDGSTIINHAAKASAGRFASGTSISVPELTS
jgi:hypothetical protein